MVSRRLAVFAVLTVAFLGSVVVAILDWSLSSDGCSMGMEFERSSSELLERRRFPPKEVCRFEYESGPKGAAIAPPEVVVHDSAVTLAFAFAMGITLVTYSGWALKTQHGRPGDDVEDGPAAPTTGLSNHRGCRLEKDP